MIKEKVNSSEFAERLGAYSHAYKVEVGDALFIFTTGQIALDEKGNVLHPGEIVKQSEVVFDSPEKVLCRAGASLEDVVKATVFLTDIKDFPKFSHVRNKYFKKAEPASTLVEVKSLVKEGCLVEVEVIAVKQKKG